MVKLARWKPRTGRPQRVHATTDGIKTGCGALIPEQALVTRDAEQWYLHTNCYNCAYRLWGPDDYIRPANSQDFPPRKKCEHRQDPKACLTCTPRPPANWPCPNGCTDPADHRHFNGFRWRTRCTVIPETNPTGPGGRCEGRCESEDAAIHRANPALRFDFSDSAMTTCYHCGNDIDFSVDAAQAEW